MRHLMTATAAVVLGLGLLGYSVSNQAADHNIDPPQPDVGRRQVEWVARSLKSMQTIKAGMTRADLLKMFTEEGGLSNRLRRTYAYRECPYFKVDVEFTPVNPAGKEGEPGQDTIGKISKPYLDWSIVD